MAAVEEKFPWDFDKPEDTFWQDIGWKESRSFFDAFPSRELAQSSVQSKLPDPSLSHNEKLQLLVEILDQRPKDLESSASTKTPPITLRSLDNTIWRNLWHSTRTQRGSLGDSSSDQEIKKMLMSHDPSKGDSPQPNLSEHHSMAVKLYEKGKYEEAEAMGKEVLEWLENHRMCGRDSPQALSMRRLLVRIAWKLGDERKAEERMGELRWLVEGLPEWKFEKYAEEEREMLEDLVVELKA